MNNKLLIALGTVGVLGASLFSGSKIFAETNSTGNPMSNLVQKIADKFGLNKSDVQAVFDQDRQDRQIEMETQYETKLSEYVTQGKITEEQKQLILAKHKELQAKHDADRKSFENLSVEERKAQMEAKKTEMDTERQELETWAKENGIDVQYVMGFGMRGGMGKGMGRHADLDSTSTQQ